MWNCKGIGNMWSNVTVLNWPRKQESNINTSLVSKDTETGEQEPKLKTRRLFSWTELRELEQEIVLAETVNELAVAVYFIMDNILEMWEKLSHTLVWKATFGSWWNKLPTGNLKCTKGSLTCSVTRGTVRTTMKCGIFRWRWQAGSEIYFVIKYFKGLNCQNSQRIWRRDGFLFTYWGLAYLQKKKTTFCKQKEYVTAPSNAKHTCTQLLTMKSFWNDVGVFKLLVAIV